MVILYILLLAIQVVSFVLAIRRNSKKHWILLFVLETLSALLAWRLGIWFDGLPGYGIMPGLTYFFETLFSYGAAILYCGMLAVSAVTGILLHCKRK